MEYLLSHQGGVLSKMFNPLSARIIALGFNIAKNHNYQQWQRDSVRGQTRIWFRTINYSTIWCHTSDSFSCVATFFITVREGLAVHNRWNILRTICCVHCNFCREKLYSIIALILCISTGRVFLLSSSLLQIKFHKVLQCMY